MKILFLIGIFLSSTAFAATCTSTTRNNYTTNQVLTSSALNADFNQLVTKANAFDGGCITDDTLEATAVDSSWDTLFKAVHQGCKVSYSDSNTISVGKCLAAVNGNLVATTGANTATWACSGCSSEVASTTYYVYAKTGSTGTTLNLLISTTAPNEDGYDNSGNKVLGRFYNDASSNIDQYSIDQWTTNRFAPQTTGWVSCTMTITATSVNPAKNGTPTRDECRFMRVGDSMFISYYYKHTSAGTAGTGDYLFSIPNSSLIDTNKRALAISTAEAAPYMGEGAWNNAANTDVRLRLIPISTSTLKAMSQATASTTAAVGAASGLGSTNFQITFLSGPIPIAGWSN